jgi:hypothetical protein
MLNELLQAKLITLEQANLYELFAVNELGRKVFEDMTAAYLMDQPASMDAAGAGYAFYAGRLAVFTDIRRAILFVTKQLKENNHVN